MSIQTPTFKMSGYSATSAKIGTAAETQRVFHGGIGPKHVYINLCMAQLLRKEVFGGLPVQGKFIHGCRIHVVMNFDSETFLCTQVELPRAQGCVIDGGLNEV